MAGQPSLIEGAWPPVPADDMHKDYKFAMQMSSPETGMSGGGRLNQPSTSASFGLIPSFSSDGNVAVAVAAAHHSFPQQEIHDIACQFDGMQDQDNTVKELGELYPNMRQP